MLVITLLSTALLSLLHARLFLITQLEPEVNAESHSTESGPLNLICAFLEQKLPCRIIATRKAILRALKLLALGIFLQGCTLDLLLCFWQILGQILISASISSRPLFSSS